RPALPLLYSLLCSRDHRDLPSFPTRRSSDLCSKHDLSSKRQRTALAVRASCLPQLAGRQVACSDCCTLSDRRTAHFGAAEPSLLDRKSTRLNSSHVKISYAVFCLKKKKKY